MRTNTTHYHYSHEEKGQSVFQPSGPIQATWYNPYLTVYPTSDAVQKEPASNIELDYVNSHTYVMRVKGSLEG
jgi:hypothetical protein